MFIQRMLRIYSRNVICLLKNYIMSTTVKVKFCPSMVAGFGGSIVYLVCRHRVVRQIATRYRLYPDEWDEGLGQVVAPGEGSKDYGDAHADYGDGRKDYGGGRKDYVRKVKQQIHSDLKRLNSLIVRYDRSVYDYSSDDIVRGYKRIMCECTLFVFMGDVIGRQRRSNHFGVAKNYEAALNSFRRFRGGVDVLIDTIDHRMVDDYQKFLLSTGIVRNSVSFYMRVLRAVYNRAVIQDITPDNRPFRNVFTGMEKTRKRAISVDDIRRVRRLDLSLWPGLSLARDVFMFLFFCRGMSFVDAAYLRKTDVSDGRIIYRRQKTGQKLNIKVVGEIQKIIDRHSIEGSPYLLPIIGRPSKDSRRQYSSALRKINKNLKTIATMANLSVPLTTYVSRHSWATIAKAQNVPIYVISDALGHDSVTTTQIYLDSIDESQIDEANEKVISMVF